MDLTGFNPHVDLQHEYFLITQYGLEAELMRDLLLFSCFNSSFPLLAKEKRQFLALIIVSQHQQHTLFFPAAILSDFLRDWKEFWHEVEIELRLPDWLTCILPFLIGFLARFPGPDTPQPPRGRT